MDQDKLLQWLPKGMHVELDPKVKAVITLKKSHKISDAAVKNAVSRLIGALGLDTRDENLQETPRRILKLWTEFLKPQVLELKTFAGPGAMVMLKRHRFVAVCPHHLLPFEMVGNVAYIPQDHRVGLSKLCRILEFAGNGFMLQENITEFTAELLSNLLLPRGVAVSVSGEHGCMRLRGVRTTGSVTTTAVRGVFLTDEKARNEFLHTNGGVSHE